MQNKFVYVDTNVDKQAKLERIQVNVKDMYKCRRKRRQIN